MIRRIRLVALGILFCTSVLAQQRPIQSLYMFDPLLINPAYAGTQVQLSSTAIYRNQWVNLDGAPKTFTATMHSGFSQTKMGLGIILANDQIGIHSDASVYGVYSYKIKLSESASLSFGLQGGFNNLRSDYNKLNLKNQGDPNLAGVLTKMNPNVGTGFFYRNRSFYFGGSSPQLIRNKVFDVEDAPTSVSLSRQNRYYYFLTGTTVELSNQVKLFPSALFRFQDEAPFSFDLNTTVVLYNVVGFGVSYRLQEGVVGLFELQINENFHVGYAYDYTASELRQYSNGSHELMINYRIKIPKIHRGLACPAYW